MPDQRNCLSHACARPFTLLGMQRRQFLHVVKATALAGCVTGQLRTPKTAGIAAIAFDLFTLFDPRSVDRRIAELLPGVDAPTFATTWKSSLFQYSWLRSAAGRYVAFDRLVVDALEHAGRVHGVTLTPKVRQALSGSFTTLDVWPDASRVLRDMRARGLRLAPLANFAPSMISALLASARLTDLFEHQLSTDAARTYKPDPRAYALAEHAFALPRAQVAFAAFGGWDAAGASWFGLPTFWVNRFGVPPEELDVPHVAMGSDLDALRTWIDSQREVARV